MHRLVPGSLSGQVGVRCIVPSHGGPRDEVWEAKNLIHNVLSLGRFHVVCYFAYRRASHSCKHCVTGLEMEEMSDT